MTITDPNIAWEIAKVAVGVLTPLTVAAVGYYLNQRLKSIDHAQWQNRKIVEKRIELYDEIAPNLNKVYCFSELVGYWKDVSPRDVLKAKRELDKTVNIYRHLLSERFYKNYNVFVHLIFRTYSGWGEDAKILSKIANNSGSHKEHGDYEWELDFDEMFEHSENYDQDQVKDAYLQTMQALRACIGLETDLDVL